MLTNKIGDSVLVKDPRRVRKVGEAAESGQEYLSEAGHVQGHYTQPEE